MPEKDGQTQGVTIIQQETVNRLTSDDGPPPYSEVKTHDWTVRNDPRITSAQPYNPSRVLMTPNPAAQNSADNYHSTTTNATSTVLKIPPTSVVTRAREQPPEYELQIQPYNNMILLMIISLLLLFMLGTPLTLLCTVPALYHICKVYYVVSTLVKSCHTN